MRIREIFKIKKTQVIGLTVAVIILILSLIFLRGQNIFYFILAIAFVIAGMPFFVSLIVESNLSREKEEMFLEFSRYLVESVKVGVPISKSIMNVRKKDYGSLNPYINKLANQISLGIPLQAALETFARDLNNGTILRAVTIISESEKAGGSIDEILESVVSSISNIEKLRKERRAAIAALAVQGYIIYFIFIVIMLVMQFQILPVAAGLSEGFGDIDSASLGGGLGSFIGGEQATPEQLARPFIWLLLIQGFFVGLVIGKLAEGSVRSGIKHSFILIFVAILVNTGAKAFIG